MTRRRAEVFEGTSPLGKTPGRNPKGGSVKKTTASELTLITGIGRVPLTRTQVATLQRRTTKGDGTKRGLSR